MSNCRNCIFWKGDKQGAAFSWGECSWVKVQADLSCEEGIRGQNIETQPDFGCNRFVSISRKLKVIKDRPPQI